MQYLTPTEAKWWLQGNTEKMQELLEPQEERSTTKEPRRVRRWWRSMEAVFGISRSGLRNLEPVEGKQ